MNWQDELREQIQGAHDTVEVSADLVRRALIHMDAAVREVFRIEFQRTVDLARMQVLEAALEKTASLVRDYATTWEQASLLNEESDEDEYVATQEACSAAHTALMTYAENYLWDEDGEPCSGVPK